MDYEKLYKESLERARQFSEHPLQEDSDSIVEYIFPELKESEDERIRNWLIGYFNQYKEDGMEKYANGLKVESILAWLEKQSHDGKKWIYEDVYLKEKEQLIQDGIDEVLENPQKYGLEKQGEQKPADKIEPKFKVGDWVVFNNKHQSTYQVEKIEDWYYILRHTHGGTFRVCVLHDENLRLWDITKDAKDGDVLTFKNDICGIIICKSPTDYDTRSYCRLVSDSFINKEESGWDSTLLVPATKEQRDLLFQKMKEAGYEWDAEKKELKKIEPFDKYEGLTDFERTLADICIGWIGEEPGWKEYIKDNADVLLKIAIKKFNSVQDVPFEQKPAWSEEHELKNKEL